MTDAEKFWNEHAADVRKLMGFSPLTPAEASEALKKLPQREASDDDVESILEAVRQKRPPERDWEQPDWSAEYNYEAMDREAALCRNRGDHDPESDKAEDDLFNELLRDDDPEDEDGMGG